jgi:hypothetical protein
MLRDSKDTKPTEKVSPRERRIAEKRALQDAREENTERRHKERLAAMASASASIAEIGETHKEMKNMLREILDRN